MDREPTPAELAAAPPPPPPKEPTPAEIAMQGLGAAVVSVPEDAPAIAPETKQEAAEAPKPSATEQEVRKAEPRYQTQLQALMAKARAARDVQVKQEDPDVALVQKLKIAKELGPDAVLKAVGIERPKIDIEKLLHPDRKPDPNKELNEKIAKIDKYIEHLEARSQEQAQQAQQQQWHVWEQRELGSISEFIDKTKEKYEYVGAAKDIGSDKDIYNGLVSMYNQGYSPNYDEMADLVESRIEQLLDLISPTKKFSDYVGKRFGVQLAHKASGSATITEDMKSDPQESVDLNKMSEEENLKYALKSAYEARERAMKVFK